MSLDVSVKEWASGQTIHLDLELSEIDELAKAVKSTLQPLDWILLEGDLGAGKTTFVKSLAVYLGASQQATSPTFSLLNVLNLSSIEKLSRLCHLDLYRLKISAELLHLGLELEIDRNSVAIIEWAEQVEPEGWYQFFTETKCQKPKRIALIQISRKQNESSRHYTLGWLQFEEFAHP